MEEGAPRPVPGERTVKRIASRQSRRLKVGFATAVLARSMSTDEAVEGESDDGLVYLSASPFYAMMRRLAQARWRRARREKALARRTEPRMRAWKRRWPGETKGIVARLASVAVDRLVLAQPQAAPEAAAPTVEEVVRQVSPRKLTVRRRSDAQALLNLLKKQQMLALLLNPPLPHQARLRMTVLNPMPLVLMLKTLISSLLKQVLAVLVPSQLSRRTMVTLLTQLWNSPCKLLHFSVFIN